MNNLIRKIVRNNLRIKNFLSIREIKRKLKKGDLITYESDYKIELIEKEYKCIQELNAPMNLSTRTMNTVYYALVHTKWGHIPLPLLTDDLIYKIIKHGKYNGFTNHCKTTCSENCEIDMWEEDNHNYI